MTEVGSMQIGGSVNTSNIESGLSRVENSLKNVAAVGDSVNADFTRINQQAKDLSKNLGIMATIGSTAIITLAKGAPAVAGAMANMRVSFGKLSRSLGESLRPAFENVSEAFQGFVSWIENNSGTITDFTSNAISGLTLGISSLVGAWNALSSISIPVLDIEIGEGLKFLISNFGAELIAGLIGTKFLGIPGGLAAAGVTSVSKSESEGFGGAAVGAATGAAIGTGFLPGLGTAAGFGIGSLIGRGIDLFLGRQDRKSTSLELEDAI